MTIDRSIIVPCYNEELNLPTLIRRFAELWREGDTWELILVNNGSIDNSAVVLEQELVSRPFARVVTVPSPNIGYGHGIMTGLRAAQGEYLAWTHADGQTAPRDVFTAFDLLSSARSPERTFIKGRRRKRPLKDTSFTFAMEVAATAVLWRSMPDINGQPKAFPRALLNLATDPPLDLSLDLYFFWLAKTNGFKIETFDVRFGSRESGLSKWAFNWRSKVRNISRTVQYLVALRARRR